MLTFRQITKISTRGVENSYATAGKELWFSPEHASNLMALAQALSVSSEISPDSIYQSYIECRKFFTVDKNEGQVGCFFGRLESRNGEHEEKFCVFVFSENKNKGILMEVDIDDMLYKKGETIYNTIVKNIKEHQMKKDYGLIDEILDDVVNDHSGDKNYEVIPF